MCIRLLCVSLEGKLRPCFITELIGFPTEPFAFSLFLHALTSLISNCLSLLFGTQGRPRRLKPFSTNKKRGHRGTAVPRKASEGPAQFHCLLSDTHTHTHTHTHRGIYAPTCAHMQAHTNTCTYICAHTQPWNRGSPRLLGGPSSSPPELD